MVSCELSGVRDQVSEERDQVSGIRPNPAPPFLFGWGYGRGCGRGRGIWCYPLSRTRFLPGFQPQHHPPYQEFYDRVLPQTREPREIEETFEIDFASRPEYIDRYRHRYAYHGVHPFYAWAWGCLAMKQMSRILVVGARDPKIIEHLGFTPVPTVENVPCRWRERAWAKVFLLHIWLYRPYL